MPRILAFAGSAREQSVNRRALGATVELVREAGAEVTLAEMRDYEMPLYDGDLEARDGLPEGADRFRRLLLDHDGLLVASPEYNSSITPLLKNSIDWVSRPQPDKLSPFQGKVAALISASPGALGGLRGLVHLRMILGNIGVVVLPEQVAVGGAGDAFDATGRLRDARRQKSLENLVDRLIAASSALSTGS